MNDLLNLIDKRIERQLKDSKGLTSIPCRVLEIFNNNTARVLVVQNNTEYTVPNYSGSDLIIGEEAQLFCQGSISSGRFKYIGASVNKQSNSGSSFGCILGTSIVGEVFNNERTVSQININCKSESPCLLFFNATVFGSSSGNITIKCYMDEIVDDFTVIKTIHADEHSIISFSLPLIPTIGEHIIEISAIGIGNIISLNSYVLGNIEKYDIHDATEESDYIYINDKEESNIVYYIGESKYPEIPTTLQGLPVSKLLATSFNYSDIVSAYIPEGVEEIE